MSFTMMAAVFALFAATISSRDGPAVGCFTSLATSAARSATGSPPEGSSTARTFLSGTERKISSFPHFSTVFTALRSLQERYEGRETDAFCALCQKNTPATIATPSASVTAPGKIRSSEPTNIPSLCRTFMGTYM